MSEALRMFTEGFEGELFNRPGTPWPEADVTIVDLGTLAREGYEAQMAVAVISLLNTINNIVSASSTVTGILSCRSMRRIS
jgi:hypothetical protein